MSKFFVILGVIFLILVYLFFKFIRLIFTVNKPNRDLDKKPDFNPEQKKSSIDKSKAVDAKYEEIK
jgi:phosphotransferase system  glucose/maltose/N-acetylglucosamine-specific IIC component